MRAPCENPAVDAPARIAGIVVVEAAVFEEADYHSRHPARPGQTVVRSPAGSDRLGLRVVLGAVLDDGRRVTAENCMGIGGPPGMVLAEATEAIDRMLGRRAELGRPPRLAWGPLVSALEEAGLPTTEDELIGAKLEVRLEPSARAVLALV